VGLSKLFISAALAIGTAAAQAQGCSVRIGNACLPSGSHSGNITYSNRNGVESYTGLPSDAYRIDPRTGRKIEEPKLPPPQMPVWPQPRTNDNYEQELLQPRARRAAPNEINIGRAFLLNTGKARFLCGAELLDITVARDVSQICFDLNAAPEGSTYVYQSITHPFRNKVVMGRNSEAYCKDRSKPVRTQQVSPAGEDINCLVVTYAYK
jgi:hypothetical protein